MDEEIVEDLRAGTSEAASGQFTLDPEQAREKLQKYQLRDPHEYILQFVETAHLLDATWIHIQIDADEVEMHFDGAPIGLEEVDSIYAAAFHRSDDAHTEAVRHLAIGLISAREVDPAVVVVESAPRGESREGAALTIDRDGEESIESHPGPEGATSRIYLRETLRAAHIPKFFHKFQGELTEQKLVRERCRYSPIPVALDGELVNADKGFSDSIRAEVEFETEFESGIVGLHQPYHREYQGGLVQLIQNGVSISRTDYPVDLSPVRASAIVRTSRLQRNLSQGAFVEDEAWTELMEGVLPDVTVQMAIVFVSELTERDVKRYVSWLQRLFWTMHAKLAGEPTEAELRLLRVLSRTPILPTATPLECDLEAIEVEGVAHVAPADVAKESDVVRYATERFPYTPREDGPILWWGDRASSAIETSVEVLFGEAEDVTDELARERKRRANRDEWKGRSPYQRPTGFAFQFESSAEEGELSCEVYMRGSRAAHELDVVKEGRLLESRSLGAVPLPEGVSLIAGPVEPNDLWSGPEPNREFRRAIYRLLTLIPGTLAETSERYVENRNTIPEWLLEAQLAMLRGEFLTDFFDAVELSERGGADEFREWYEAQCAGDFEESIWALRPSSFEAAEIYEESENLEEELAEGDRPGASEPRARDRIRRLGPLADVPLYRGVGTGWLSLREICEHFEETGRIRYLDGPPSEAAGSGADASAREGTSEALVWADWEGRKVLSELFGGAVGRAGSSELLEAAESVSFSEDRYAATAELEGEEWRADLGLLPVRAEEGRTLMSKAWGGTLEMVLVFRGKQIATRYVALPSREVRAVVESEAWSVEPGFSDVRRDSFYLEVRKGIRGGVRRLIVAHCEETLRDVDEGSDPRLVDIWRTMAEVPDEGVYARLREFPAFEVVGEGLVSHRELESRIESSIFSGVVVGDVEVDAETSHGVAQLVRVPNVQGTQRLLQTLFDQSWIQKAKEESSEAARGGEIGVGASGADESAEASAPVGIERTSVPLEDASIEPPELRDEGGPESDAPGEAEESERDTGESDGVEQRRLLFGGSAEDVAERERDESPRRRGWAAVEEAVEAEFAALAESGESVGRIADGGVEIAETRGAWVEVGPDGTLRIDPAHDAVSYAVASVDAAGEPEPVALAALVSALYTAACAAERVRKGAREFMFHANHAERVAERLSRRGDSSEES